MNWTQFLETKVESTYATTLKLVDKVDAGSLGWKPSSGANWMTVGQLLKHLTIACGVAMKGLVTGDWGLPEGAKMEDLPADEMFPPAEKLPSIASVDDARKQLLDDEAVALKIIADAGEEALALKEVTAPWSPGQSFPLGLQLFEMVLHLDRHKSQLFYYLKLQGKAVGTLDLWG